MHQHLATSFCPHKHEPGYNLRDTCAGSQATSLVGPSSILTVFIQCLSTNYSQMDLASERALFEYCGYCDWDWRWTCAFTSAECHTVKHVCC